MAQRSRQPAMARLPRLSGATLSSRVRGAAEVHICLFNFISHPLTSLVCTHHVGSVINSVTASGVGSTALYTAAPANGGGLITTSFDALDDSEADRILLKHLEGSSRLRHMQLISHAKCVGTYAFSKSSKNLIFTLLLTPGFDNSSGTEVDSYVTTTSNNAGVGRYVVTLQSEVTGSTLRLVTKEFAATLPPTWKGKGSTFSKSTQKAASLRQLLPALPPGHTKYVIISCPNTIPIKPGSPAAYKGQCDDTLVGTFEEQNGPIGKSWLLIQSTGHTGVFPFDAAFQKAVHDNRATLDSLYPSIGSAASLAAHPHITLTNAPMEDEESHPLQLSVDQLTSTLKLVVQRNLPAPQLQAPKAPIQQVEVQSNQVHDPSQDISNLSSNSTYVRLEAKLRLFTMGYDPATNNITLFDINDDIKAALLLSSKNQAESFSNLIFARSQLLADDLDRVNCQSDWPESYTSTP